MKKLLSLVFCGLLLFGCSDKYDDSALRNDLNDLENRVYNRGIQMYRFPNSDVQKSVIFEGIKKRLKIV